MRQLGTLNNQGVTCTSCSWGADGPTTVTSSGCLLLTFNNQELEGITIEETSVWVDQQRSWSQRHRLNLLLQPVLSHRGNPEKYDSSNTIFTLTGKIIPSISRSKILSALYIQATGYLTSEGSISLGTHPRPFKCIVMFPNKKMSRSKFRKMTTK